MREVELWTATGFVAVVEIAPFPDRGMPDVVTWGDRVFINKDEDQPANGRWIYREACAVVSFTKSIAVEKGGGARACRWCGVSLVTENYSVADGCPCNSPRGVNHGLVAKETCTCTVCDPEQTGSTRHSVLDRARSVVREIEADAHEELVNPRIPAVDRSARCTVGEAIAPGVPNTEDRGDGQQKGYVILCEEERKKGFVRPVRRTYRHAKCGTTTTMGQALSETYARDPLFYSGTFCCTCGSHFPVGVDGEFVWEGTNEKVGT